MTMLSLRQILQGFVRFILGTYQLNRIYFKDLEGNPVILPVHLELVQLKSHDQVSELGTHDLKTHAWYARPGALGYGIKQDGQLVCMCWYWLKSDPRTPARFFSQLKDDEPVMVDLITARFCRGQGYANFVVRYSEQQLRQAGYRRLWTWVWHSNHPSMRTFEKCGWRYHEFLIDVELFRSGKSLQIHLSLQRFPRFIWLAQQAPVAEPIALTTVETLYPASPKGITDERPYASK